MDLISRQTALDALGLSEKTRKHSGDRSGYDTMMLYEIQDILEGLPSAEPENIHCRDCKYAHLTYDGFCKYCDKWVDGDGTPLTVYLDGDFYCGFAERRIDE